MILGILTFRNHRYHPNRRLLEAARGLGHKAVLLDPKRLFLGLDDQGFRVDHLSMPLRADVIVPRIGSTIREFPLTAVRHFQLLGIPVVNRYESILLARSKFLTLQTLSLKGISVPESRYVSNRSNFEGAVSRLGGFPLILKTAHSRQGRGVFLVHSMEESQSVLEGLLGTGQGLLVQRFLPPEKRRDIRILVVGERVIGAMALLPRRGEFRANIHLGAHPEKIRPTDEMAATALGSTRALGLDISGVDMIEEDNGALRVIEVNYSPGFRGLEKCTGTDVASEIIKHATTLKREDPCRSPF